MLFIVSKIDPLVTPPGECRFMVGHTKAGAQRPTLDKASLGFYRGRTTALEESLRLSDIDLMWLEDYLASKKV